MGHIFNESKRMSIVKLTRTFTMLLLLAQPPSLLAGKYSPREHIKSAMGMQPSQNHVKMVPIGGSVSVNNRHTVLAQKQASAKGEGDSNRLIVNGEPAYAAEFKYQALLLVETRRGMFMICGGTILDSRHVMTAAHCILDYMEGNAGFRLVHRIIVGINNRTLGLDSPDAQTARVTHYKRPQRYRDVEYGDIALLYLDRDIVETRHVQFAKLATPEMGDFLGEDCFMTGWGQLSQHLDPSELLQVAETGVISNEECVDIMAISAVTVDDEIMCIHNYPKSSCFGDSGGPLTCGHFVAGVSSWTSYSCSGCWPQGYTRVTSYDQWIKDGLKNRRGYRKAKL